MGLTDADDSEEAEEKCCASCGIAEVDDIKLTECDGCDLARYCSDECQANHRPDHESECKERAAELRDEIVFKQPESTHLGDCPICCVPLPIDEEKSILYTCCCRLICKGCDYTNRLRQYEQNIRLTCAFCRQNMPKTREEINKNRMKRIDAKDPVALRQMGLRHFEKGDYDRAFKCLAKAAELGDADSHYNLSIMYNQGNGVEKDEVKELYHLEEAAIAGQPAARHDLGVYEWNKRSYDRAVKHFMIAASLGDDGSIQDMKKCYKHKLVSKEDFAAALRAHHAAVKATKSPEREEAGNNFDKFFGHTL